MMHQLDHLSSQIEDLKNQLVDAKSNNRKRKIIEEEVQIGVLSAYVINPRATHLDFQTLWIDFSEDGFRRVHIYMLTDKLLRSRKKCRRTLQGIPKDLSGELGTLVDELFKLMIKSTNTLYFLRGLTGLQDQECSSDQSGVSTPESVLPDHSSTDVREGEDLLQEVQKSTSGFKKPSSSSLSKRLLPGLLLDSIVVRLCDCIERVDDPISPVDTNDFEFVIRDKIKLTTNKLRRGITSSYKFRSYSEEEYNLKLTEFRQRHGKQLLVNEDMGDVC